MAPSDTSRSALLPNGLKDLLPPEARHEAGVMRRLMGVFASHGYGHVDPPLVEYEDTLFAGPGARLSDQCFRIMDPVSQAMMGLRADITPQIARIATTRLKSEPRPLRLAYGGPVLRVRGGQLRPERQFPQTGAELFGPDSAQADGESIALACEAVAAVGAGDISVDVALPTLAPEVIAAFDAPEALRADLEEALERRDASALGGLDWAGRAVTVGLVRAAGPADAALTALEGLDLPGPARAVATRAAAVVAAVRARTPGLAITLDPVERRGFEYQTGVAFTLFARGVRGELGRGGRYLAGRDGEPAVGFSLYLDSLMRALPPAGPVRRLFVPLGTPAALARALRAEGWVTVAGLAEIPDPRAEAARLGCGHVLEDGAPRALD